MPPESRLSGRRRRRSCPGWLQSPRSSVEKKQSSWFYFSKKKSWATLNWHSAFGWKWEKGRLSVAVRKRSSFHCLVNAKGSVFGNGCCSCAQVGRKCPYTCTSGSLPPPADPACVHLALFTHAGLLIAPLYRELLSYGVRKCVNKVLNTSN